MNGQSRVGSALPTRAKGVGHLRQVAAVAAALVLGIRSNAQTTAVRAASAQDATPVDKTFSLSFHPPSVICVGEGSPVKVTTLLEMSGTNSTGQHFDYKDNVVPGITIEAKVQDQSIATVSPSHDSTGMLPSPDDLLLPGQLSSPYHQRAEVTFTIKGLKPGTDNLYLTAHIPQRISGAAGTQKEAAVVFRVRAVPLSSEGGLADVLHGAGAHKPPGGNHGRSHGAGGQVRVQQYPQRRRQCRLDHEVFFTLLLTPARRSEGPGSPGGYGERGRQLAGCPRYLRPI